MISTKSLIPTKVTWRLFIAVFAIGYVFLLKSSLGTKRSVSIQTRHEFGVAIINNIKYKVPYTIVETVVPVRVNNIVDYLFISNTALNECFLSLIIKLALCICLLIESYTLTDLDQYRNNGMYRTMVYLLFALVFSEIFKQAITAQSVANQFKGYQYNNNFYGLIQVIAIARLIQYRGNIHPKSVMD